MEQYENPADYQLRMMQREWEQEREQQIETIMRAPDKQPQAFTQEPNTKLDELISAYPSMRFLKKSTEAIDVDEWYSVMLAEKEALWKSLEDNHFLPAHTKHSLGKVYVRHISYYHFNGIKKQRAFFSVPRGQDTIACFHSGKVTEGLKMAWNPVEFSVTGKEQMHGVTLNKVSNLQIDYF